MFRSVIEDLQNALGDCTEGVADGLHYCSMVQSGGITFCSRCMVSPVARLGEATSNDMGAYIELDRAVALEEDMECFVEYVRGTAIHEPWQDLLNRLTVMVDVARQHLDTSVWETSPTTSPEEQADPQAQSGRDKDHPLVPVKTEYGECSSTSLGIEGSGSNVGAKKEAKERTSPSGVRGKVSLSLCREGVSHGQVEEPADSLLFETGEEKNAAMEGVISPKGEKTGTYLHLKAELGPHVRMSAQFSLLPNSGGEALSDEEGALPPGEGKKVARLVFEAEIEAEDSGRKSKKMRLSPACEGGDANKMAEDVGSQVRSHIRFWADGVERTLEEAGADYSTVDMAEAVGRLRAAVSEPGVKSVVVNLRGRDVLREIERCLDALGKSAGKTELAEHHKSLEELLVRQLHEDSTDEVRGFPRANHESLLSL